MTFNPYTWNNTEPSPSQLISNGQSTILNNFNFLGDTTGNVSNGYFELPSGLIVQWNNYINIPDGQIITFPTKFPNNCFNVTLTIIKDSGSAQDFAYVKSIATTSTSQFIVRTVGDNLPFDIFWLAIGN